LRIYIDQDPRSTLISSLPNQFKLRQPFGQEDDRTSMTAAFAPVGALHACSRICVLLAEVSHA